MATLSKARIRMYANLVKAGRWTIEDVPEPYQAAVQRYIDTGEYPD